MRSRAHPQQPTLRIDLHTHDTPKAIGVTRKYLRITGIRNAENLALVNAAQIERVSSFIVSNAFRNQSLFVNSEGWNTTYLWRSILFNHFQNCRELRQASN